MLDRITIAVLTSVLMLLVGTPAHAVDRERGKQLHHDNCLTCHGTELYIRPQPGMLSYSELREQVYFWQMTAHLEWTEADIEDVTDYLNEFFYKFECPHHRSDVC